MKIKAVSITGRELAALRRVVAMGEEMSGDTCYHEHDEETGLSLGVRDDVQRDIDLAKQWLQRAAKTPAVPT